MKSNHRETMKMILAAFFLAAAYVLPFLTGQIPAVGTMLCPMHLPVLLCGFLCGWPWGLAVGALAPLMRSLTLGAPVFYPMAVCMMLELATYGVVAGVMHRLLPRKKPYIYTSLLTAMVTGRLVWGAAMFLCLGARGEAFGISAFLAGGVTGAIPGIVLQILLVPLLVVLAEKLLAKNGYGHLGEGS